MPVTGYREPGVSYRDALPYRGLAIPDEPPPADLWTCDILALDGSSVLVTAAKFRSARLTWALDGSGAAEVGLMPADVADGDWLYGRRRIRFQDGDDVAWLTCWLDRLERAGHPGAVKYRATGRGLGAILDMRLVHPALIDLATPATTIASDIIANVAAQAGDTTLFTLGTITGTAPDRDRFICDAAVASDAINELANMDDGFNWEIDPAGQFNAWNGGRGTDRSGSITLAPSDTIDWVDVADISELATYVTGNIDAGECDPYTLLASSSLAATYGRREGSLDEDDKTDPDELIEKMTEELRARAGSGASLSVAWIEGHGNLWDFGDVWLGDIVNVERGAEFGGNADMRIITITLTLEPGMWAFPEYELELA